MASPGDHQSIMASSTLERSGHLNVRNESAHLHHSASLLMSCACHHWPSLVADHVNSQRTLCIGALYWWRARFVTGLLCGCIDSRQKMSRTIWRAADRYPLHIYVYSEAYDYHHERFCCCTNEHPMDLARLIKSRHQQAQCAKIRM